jgi:DNA-binding transcriptional LysR family regulator
MFHEQVVPHLRGMEKAAAAARGNGAVRGKLRINFNPVFSRVILGSKLDDFMEAHNELELEFIARDQLG